MARTVTVRRRLQTRCTRGAKATAGRAAKARCIVARCLLTATPGPSGGLRGPGSARNCARPAPHEHSVAHAICTCASCAQFTRIRHRRSPCNHCHRSKTTGEQQLVPSRRPRPLPSPCTLQGPPTAPRGGHRPHLGSAEPAKAAAGQPAAMPSRPLPPPESGGGGRPPAGPSKHATIPTEWRIELPEGGTSQDGEFGGCGRLEAGYERGPKLGEGNYGEVRRRCRSRGAAAWRPCHAAVSCRSLQLPRRRACSRARCLRLATASAQPRCRRPFAQLHPPALFPLPSPTRQVFLATELSSGEQVAVKRVKGWDQQEGGFPMSAIQEVRRIATSQHRGYCNSARRVARQPCGARRRPCPCKSE